MVKSDEQEILRADLRNTARVRRAGLAESARIAAADAAARHFRQNVSCGDRSVIAGYWPINGEIDPRPLLSQLARDAFVVCLPVVRGAGQPLVFRIWEPGARLVPAGFGTLAPDDQAPEAIPDVMIVPLVGFDASGTRLGYGGGYYDRTIAAFETKPVLVGYGFSVQELPDIPRAGHDMPLDFAVTEMGVRRFAHVAASR